jgi:hypothetical protein
MMRDKSTRWCVPLGDALAWAPEHQASLRIQRWDWGSSGRGPVEDLALLVQAHTVRWGDTLARFGLEDALTGWVRDKASG